MEPQSQLELLDDATLVQRFRSNAASAESADAASEAWSTGDPHALSVLYARHAPALRAFHAASVPRSRLEDLCQETWLRAIRGLRGTFDGRNFRAWLFEIGRNLRTDLARRRSTDELPDDRWVVDPRTHDPGQHVFYEERTRQVEQCFQHLSEREKCVFGQILQGQAYADIRTLCACNANEAHKATHSARQKLRICLEKGAI